MTLTTLNGIVHALTECRECDGRGIILKTNYPSPAWRQCEPCDGKGYIRSEVGRVSQPRWAAPAP